MGRILCRAPGVPNNGPASAAYSCVPATHALVMLSPSSPLPRQVPVLIAGGGPVGFTLSALLARQGVANLVIEADAGYCSGSRAICVSRRSQEILGARLNTIHNLHYYLDIMQQMRDALDADRFPAWVQQFHADRARGV